MFSSTSAGSSRSQQTSTGTTTITTSHTTSQHRGPSPAPAPASTPHPQRRRLSNPPNSLDEDNNYNSHHNTRRASHQHPTFLEPPFSYADRRPSSPRHHSTTSPSTANPRRSSTGKPPTPAATSATARTTLQLPDDHIPSVWGNDDENRDGDNGDTIVLPRLRPVESLASAVGWTADALDHFYTSSDGIHNQLSDFANQDFSSPSSYPSFTTASHVPFRGIETSQRFVHPHSTSRCPARRLYSTGNTNLEPPHSASTSLSNLSTLSAHTSTTATTSDSQFSASTSSAYLESLDNPLDHNTMPPTTRRSSVRPAEPIVLEDHHVNKRQRTSEQGRGLKKEPQSQPRFKPAVQDDPFADSDDEDAAKPEDEPLMIDLTETPAAPKDEKPACEAQEDNRTKLGAFQCVICMDNVTTLTVTHCGTFPSRHVHPSSLACPDAFVIL